MLGSLLRGRAIAGGFIAFAAAAAVTASALSPALGTGPEGITSFSGTSSSAIVTSHNSGTGQAISASGSTGAGTGVIYATTAAAGSTAIRGYASSTSLTPSYGVIGVSKNAFGVYAVTSASASNALFAFNTNTIAGGAIKGQSAGNAITGISTRGNGVVGQVSATPTPMPSAAFALAGVLGRDTSTGFNNAGVAGTSTNGFGVFGKSSLGSGVRGEASSGDGVFGRGSIGVEGLSPSGFGVRGSSSSGYGVRGDSTGGIGVYGESTNSNGVFGLSTTSVGVGGNSSSSIGVSGNSGSSIGVQGSSTSSNGVQGNSTSGSGVFASSQATPRPDATTLPNANNIYTAALAVYTGGGAPLIIARGTSGNDVMSLDNTGNLVVKGSVTATAFNVIATPQPLVIHRTALGKRVGTYAAEQTVRTIEDVGEGQLLNGRAYVRLDPTFAATIDPRANYLVFITPEGPSRGLYVAEKSLRGFAVRENPGGNATLAFSYRIVAKPLDSNAPRLPLVQTFPQHPAGPLPQPRAL